MSNPHRTFSTGEPALSDLLGQIGKGEVQLPDFQRHGTYGCPLWRALDVVAHTHGPRNRTGQRRLRLALWHRLKWMLHGEVLFRFGRKCVTTVKLTRA
jgi:hypothetical protein